MQSIVLMMEEARTSETSVNTQLRTRQYIPEDSELHTRRRENLKSHMKNTYFLCKNISKNRSGERDARGRVPIA
jgi:hypothetical protein